LKAAGAEVWETTRGGDITYHGPGQLVGYGILDLKDHGRDLGLYLRNLEEVLIRILGRYGLTGSRRAGMTGAWVEDRKVAAIGVRAERWTTSHGFAFNVDPELSHFDWIVPCGIRDYGVASLAGLVREKHPSAPVPTVEEVAGHAQEALQEVFGISFESGDAGELDELDMPSEPPLGGIVRKFPAPEVRSG
jgi:lipoyl(octanoyl) transferase